MPVHPCGRQGPPDLVDPRRGPGDVPRAQAHTYRTRSRARCPEGEHVGAARQGPYRAARARTAPSSPTARWCRSCEKAAAEMAEKQGRSIEIVDPRTLVPLDEDIITRVRQEDRALRRGLRSARTRAASARRDRRHRRREGDRVPRGPDRARRAASTPRSRTPSNISTCPTSVAAVNREDVRLVIRTALSC